MPHNRSNRRQRGSRDEDKSPYSRDDDTLYSRSRQSDNGYRRHSSSSNRNSYDVGVREESSSSSRAVADSWQQRTDYGYQDRYHDKSRRDDYETVEARESDPGWAGRRSVNDSDLYSHSQREEWPRYDQNYSANSYQEQYSSSYSQQVWSDDVQQNSYNRSHHNDLPNDRDSRWQREERSVHEPDHGWETRNRRQAWDEPATTRFRSPSPADRQWEPAPAWNSSHRGYDSQSSHRSNHYNNQENGHSYSHQSSPDKKNSKHGKKSNGKNGGRSKQGWRENDDLNNWSRRERDSYEERYSSSRKKQSHSMSRSRSPAESHYSHRSRRHSPSPPPRVSPPSFIHSDSPPPPKRRRRNSSPRSPPPDSNDRVRTGWISPSAEKRLSISPRRGDYNGKNRRSISPVSTRSHRDRARSPTPVDDARAPSPQRLPDTNAPPAPPVVDYAPQERLPLPEPPQTSPDPPQPQTKSGKNKKKNKRRNVQTAQATQGPNISSQQPSQQIPPPSHPSQYADHSLHNSIMIAYQYAAQFYPFQVPAGMAIPPISTIPQAPLLSPVIPPRAPQSPSLPHNHYSGQPANTPHTPHNAESNLTPAPGSFVPIRNPRLKTPKSSLKQFFPGFNDDDSVESTPQTQPQVESAYQETDIPPPTDSSTSPSLAKNPPHFVPTSLNYLPPPPPRPISDRGGHKDVPKETSPSTQGEESCDPAAQPFDTYTPAPTSRPELYSILGQVGEGTFGKVYKARNTITNVHVALKRIRMESERDGFPVTAMREVKLLQSLRHDNVVRLYEMMVSSGSVYMVFEYMDHDLTGVLSQTQFQFSAAHLKSLSHQMFHGLAYLHHKGVVHRDIKGSNILINNQGELKLADFGLARFYQKRRRADYTNRVITLWYRPPELLLGATVYGPEVDIWSAGCIMLELFTKKPVFQGNDEISQLDVIYKIIGTPTLQRWSGFANLPWYEMAKPKDPIPDRFRDMFRKWMSPAALDLAERLLDFDPMQRVTAAQAMETPYFLEEEPKAEKPTSLATLEGEWHELETKRERAKKKKRE